MAQQSKNVTFVYHQVDVVDSDVFAKDFLQIADPEEVSILGTHFVLFAQRFLLVSRSFGQEVFLFRLGDDHIGVNPEGRLQEEERALTGAVLFGEGVLEVEGECALDEVGDDAALESVSRTEAVHPLSHVAELQPRAVALQRGDHDRLELHEHHRQYTAPSNFRRHLQAAVLDNHNENTSEVDQYADDGRTPCRSKQCAHHKGNGHCSHRQS